MLGRILNIAYSTFVLVLLLLQIILKIDLIWPFIYAAMFVGSFAVLFGLYSLTSGHQKSRNSRDKIIDASLILLTIMTTILFYDYTYYFFE